MESSWCFASVRTDNHQGGVVLSSSSPDFPELVLGALPQPRSPLSQSPQRWAHQNHFSTVTFSTKCLIAEGIVSSDTAPWVMEFIISVCPAEGGALRCHATPDAAAPETVQVLIVSMNSLFSFLRLFLLSLCYCQSTCLKGREVGTVTSGPVGLQGKPNTLHLEATPDSLSPELPAPFPVPLQPAPGGKHSCFHIVKMPLGGPGQG